jgi:hypothetical protein
LPYLSAYTIERTKKAVCNSGNLCLEDSAWYMCICVCVCVFPVCVCGCMYMYLCVYIYINVYI